MRMTGRDENSRAVLSVNSSLRIVIFLAGMVSMRLGSNRMKRSCVMQEDSVKRGRVKYLGEES